MRNHLKVKEMECPNCNKIMTLKKEDISINPDIKPIKKYKRKFYWCNKDDIWVTYEIPLEK